MQQIEADHSITFINYLLSTSEVVSDVSKHFLYWL